MKTRRQPLAALWLMLPALACGDAESSPVVLNFETLPSCAAADVTCVNADTTTLVVQGVRAIHKPLPGHPLVSFQLSFDDPYGSSRQRWAETLAVGMYQMGGPRRFYNASDWDAELLRLGARVSAATALDYGWISGTAPAFNWRELWDLVIEGIADYRNYSWELDYLRDYYERIFLSEYDDPYSAASIDAWSRLFADQDYDFQREYQDSLAAVSSADIDQAWVALSASPRWVVSIVGDVSADEVAAALEDARGALGQVGTSPSFAPDPLRGTPLSPHARLLPYPDAPNWYVVAYFKGPNARSPELAPLWLGLQVLDRRLFREVRDVRGLAYSTGAQLSFYRQTFGSVWLTSESPREALSVGARVISELKATGPSEAELAAARSSLSTQLLTGNVTPAGMAGTLTDWELTAGSREALDAFLAGVDQATPADVVSALAAYLRDPEITAAGGGGELDVSNLENWLPAP